MKRIVLLSLCVAAFAFAANRTITVMESSLVITGGDVTVKDGGCEGLARIAPIADQRPSQMRPWSKAACDVFKAELLKGAKVDQGFTK